MLERNVPGGRPRIVPPTREAMEEAARIIRAGGLVAFPTETVYGLGANALDPAAVARIFEAKGRPQDNPLILHIPGMREASHYAEIGETAERLMHHFWPGPLTIVLYTLEVVPEIARARLETVALRVPMNAVALDLIAASGVPIAAPSANRSGRPSPTDAQTVADDLGDAVDLILDGGPVSIGVESTVIDATTDTVRILRPGGVTRETLARYADLADDEDGAYANRSPGTRHRHYAPKIPLLLWDGPGVAFPPTLPGTWCYMGMHRPPQGARLEALFDTPEAYASALYAKLREFESSGAEQIVAELPIRGGLGEAICNRLLRAAGQDAPVGGDA